MVAVPRTLDDVDAGWVEKALRDNGIAVTVEAIEVDQIAVGEGFIGVVARIVPSYRGATSEAPASLIVKLPSPDPGAQALAQMLRLFEREHRFYSELAPSLQVRVPRCYAAQTDGDSGFALLLEDLGGLDVPDQLLGTTHARACAAIDWLADFHAAHWIGADDPAHLPWIPRPDDPINAGLQPMAEANFSTLCTVFDDCLRDDQRDLIRRATVAVPDLLLDRDLPFAVGHGDFRLDNMRFDGDELVVFDWQVILAGNGLYDVMYFVVLSLTVDQRRAWEAELLDRYFARLSAAVDPGMTRDELLDAYRRNLSFYCGILPVVVSLDIDVNDRARAFARAMVSRVLAAADDHDIASLV